ncbi:MAG: phage antirepressor protein [Firmicutes bacterium]|nr:phage antirepressor protein [Bacillota bacterium]
MRNLITIYDVRGYIDENGVAQLDLKDCARGLGFTETKGDYIRWQRVDGYLAEFGFSTSGERPEFIPENIFYRLAMKAKNETAEKFQALVADEILPAIRKHGGYLTPAKLEEVLLNPDTIIQLATELKNEREKYKRLALQTSQQSQIINELSPKATYYDLVLQNKSLLSITKIAKDYGMSGTELNKILHELGVQYKQSGVWLLYSHYAANGYTQSKTHVIDVDRNAFHTYWTQKGRLFIYDLLKSRKGILPLIEREHQREPYSCSANGF